jgi:hypothetical protein
MDIQHINRVLATIRAGTLDDNDLSLIENEDTNEWPVPDPNYAEPWLQKYVPRIGTEPGVGWSAVTAAIRERRKPVAAPAVAAAQPVTPVADEADEIIARLQRESEEADAHLREREPRQAKPAPPPGFTPAPPMPPDPPMPPMPPKAEQPITVTGKRWSEVVNDLRSLGSNGGKLPTRKVFQAWLTRNGLDVFLETK